MAKDTEVRDNHKTIRLSDSEYQIIMEAASHTRQANPSKVIRDGALSHAREIVRSSATSAEEKARSVLQRAREAAAGS